MLPWHWETARIMDIIWTHKTINIRYLLWIYCTNSLKRCMFQNELKSSRKGWDGRGQLIWYGTTAVRFHGDKLSNSNLLRPTNWRSKAIKYSTKYADTVKIGSREHIGIINVVFDGVFFWNEYLNIRIIRASPNNNAGQRLNLRDVYKVIEMRDCPAQSDT